MGGGGHQLEIPKCHGYFGARGRQLSGRCVVTIDSHISGDHSSEDQPAGQPFTALLPAFARLPLTQPVFPEHFLIQSYFLCTVDAEMGQNQKLTVERRQTHRQS